MEAIRLNTQSLNSNRIISSARTGNNTLVNQHYYKNATDHRHDIAYGDRMFIRVSMRGSAILETYMDRINGYSELIGAVREQMHGASGLAKVWIRNHTRGWSIEKPLMFYAPTRNPSAVRSACRDDHRMLSPWETH